MNKCVLGKIGLGALVTSMLLTGCGNAVDGDAGGSASAPEAAPSDFGQIDVSGAKLQCSTESIARVVPQTTADAPGHDSIIEAANELVHLALEDAAKSFQAATSMSITAAQTGEAESDEIGGAASLVQVDATNGDGHVVAVIHVKPSGSGGWLPAGMAVCDGGSTK